MAGGRAAIWAAAVGKALFFRQNNMLPARVLHFFKASKTGGRQPSFNVTGQEKNQQKQPPVQQSRHISAGHRLQQNVPFEPTGLPYEPD